MDFYIQDPSARLDYVWDWSGWLEPGDSISMYDVLGDLTIEDVSESGGIVTAWLSGGTVGQTYVITCGIETVMNRTDQRSKRIEIKER